MASRNRQRGWVGLVLILLALVIVALSAKSALKGYGLLDDKPVHAAAPGANETEQAAAITPRNALERAKGVQDLVNQGAVEQEKRIDDATSK
jgi:hypothetical protein